MMCILCGFLSLQKLINLLINFNAGYRLFTLQSEQGTMKGLCFGTLIWDDDGCGAKATIKQQLILIKQAFPIVPSDDSQHTPARTWFYSEHLHRYCHSFVTVRSKTRYHRLLQNRKQNAGDYLMSVLRQVDASV